MLYQDLNTHLIGEGRAALVKATVLQEAEQAMTALREGPQNNELLGIVSQFFYDFKKPALDFDPCTILVLATRSPLVNVRFQREGREDLVCHTDGSAGVDRRIEELEQEMTAFLAERGYHLHRFDALPQKQLAVRSGLALYGRNNLAYVEGFGTYHKLTTYYTDLPCEDGGRPLQRMQSCETCRRCREACLMGAIQTGRDLVDATRCMTYINEFIDLAPFPADLPKAAHNSLHGCQRCQLACPHNKGQAEQAIEPVTFTAAETAALLAGATPETLSDSLRAKVAELNLFDYLPLLPRNLGVLLD